MITLIKDTNLGGNVTNQIHLISIYIYMLHMFNAIKNLISDSCMRGNVFHVYIDKCKDNIS